jgi:hypothetical protein
MFGIGYFGNSGSNGSLPEALRLLLAGRDFLGKAARAGIATRTKRYVQTTKKITARHYAPSRYEERSI